MGTLRSEDSDDNENVIRAIGLKSKTTTLHVYHTFKYSSLPFFSLLRREKSLISYFIEDVKVILRGTIFSATRTALKHCCDVVSKGCSVVPTIILF